MNLSTLLSDTLAGHRLTEEEGRSAQRPAIPGRTVPLPRDLPRHNTAEVTQ